MSGHIHPAAVVDPDAVIGEHVTVGPCAIIEAGAVVGDGSEIMGGAYVASGARIGKEVKIFPHAVVGMVPQDLKFSGEPTILEVGDRTVIRECVTLNRGTSATGKTTIGADCLLMAYSHVAHDCRVGDNCILANSATLAGHVEVEDWVIIGGLVPIHQFVKIGCHVMIGGGWRVPKDVPPYVVAAGDPLKPVDINRIGLSRRGFTEEQVSSLRKAYKKLFRSGNDLKRAMAELEEMGDLGPEVAHLKDFIRASERGVIV